MDALKGFDKVLNPPHRGEILKCEKYYKNLQQITDLIMKYPEIFM